MFLLGPGAGVAAELVSLDVRREAGVVYVASELRIAAPRPQVFAALSDYANLPNLSSRFKESRLDVDAAGTTHVYTRLEGCVWFFCRSVTRHAVLQTEAPSWILATVDPDRSDFEYGVERWDLTQTDDMTTVRYTHELDPKFWVPPVIGVWVIRKTLQSDALKAARKIERMARAEGAR